MKRWIAAILIPFCLSGCKMKNQSMDKLYALRERMRQCNEISFEADITADYGTEYYTFKVACTSDSSGDISFTVIEPDTIAGIQGEINKLEGYLTFDNHVLAFKEMADDRITPVTAPWFFLTALCGGYITSCGKTNDGYLAMIRDTYEDDALLLEIVFIDEEPISAEIFWNQTRVISMKIQNFNAL